MGSYFSQYHPERLEEGEGIHGSSSPPQITATMALHVPRAPGFASMLKDGARVSQSDELPVECSGVIGEEAGVRRRGPWRRRTHDTWPEFYLFLCVFAEGRGR